jgi:hypothetical protein
MTSASSQVGFRDKERKDDGEGREAGGTHLVNVRSVEEHIRVKNPKRPVEHIAIVSERLDSSGDEGCQAGVECGGVAEQSLPKDEGVLVELEFGLWSKKQHEEQSASVQVVDRAPGEGTGNGSSHVTGQRFA